MIVMDYLSSYINMLGTDNQVVLLRVEEIEMKYRIHILNWLILELYLLIR